MKPEKIYPRTGDLHTVYLKNVITNPNITVGNFTIYHDFEKDPQEFEKNNVLYHYPINQDQLKIGKFCSIACGVKFLFNSANHTLSSLSTYPFPIFFEEWGLDVKNITTAWDNKGDIQIGNDMDRLSGYYFSGSFHWGWGNYWYKGCTNKRYTALYNCRRHPGKNHSETFPR